MKTILRSLVIVSIFLTFAPTVSWAGSVTIPHRFNKDTPAVADEVNENFDAVKKAVDGNATDITGNAGNITTNAGKITTNAGNITANTTGINDLDGWVNNLDDQVGDNGANISSLDSDLSAHESNPSAHHETPSVDYAIVEETDIDVWTRPDVGSITLTALNPGLVIVRFDGWVRLPSTTELNLGASDTSQSFALGDSGRVKLFGAATATDSSKYSFSHTRVYSVSEGEGSKTFYAIAESFTVRENVDIYGTLTAQYYPSN